MNDRRFDALTREFLDKQPRRRVFAALGGWFVTGLARSDRALACARLGHKCDSDRDCCHGSRCKGGKCRCTSRHFTNCFGKCYKLDRSELNCGACGNSCLVGETCCDGECVDLESNRNHCGACGSRCDIDERCEDGACSPLIDPEIRCLDSDEARCGDECANLLSDPDHCGRCDRACAAGYTCCGGECVNCPVGTRCCDETGICLDIVSNRAHCGRCDRACANNEICSNKTCVPCPPGRVVCGNQCCFP